MLFLRSFSFWIVSIVALILVTSTMIILWPLLSAQTLYRVANQWSRLSLWWLEKVCKIDYQVQGLEHLPTDCAAIILSKHQSTWETLAFQLILPPHSWVLKKELLYVPVFGWALALLKPIAIKRENARQALKKLVIEGKKKLDAGWWLVIFPEGTRMKPGETKEFAVGGALLAAKTGYPVVPIALNSGQFWPRQKFLKYPGTIKVVIGPVIETTNKSASEINQMTEKWIAQTMQTL